MATPERDIFRQLSEAAARVTLAVNKASEACSRLDAAKTSKSEEVLRSAIDDLQSLLTESKDRIDAMKRHLEKYRGMK